MKLIIKLTTVAVFTILASVALCGSSTVDILYSNDQSNSFACKIVAIRHTDDTGEAFYAVTCEDRPQELVSIDLGAGSNLLGNLGQVDEFSLRCPSFFQYEVVNNVSTFEMVFDCRQPGLIFESGFEL